MRWLHISDIHYNPRSDSTYTMKARDNLLEYLKKNNITADHLFVTGDFRHAKNQKNQPEVDAATSAVGYIINVANAAKIPLENIHVIPGNHDLKRFDKTIEADKIDKLESLRAEYVDNPTVFEDEHLSFLWEPFTFFIEVCKELEHQIENYKCPWLVNPRPSVVSEKLSDCFLLGINSCLFFQNGSDRGNIIIDTAKISRELSVFQNEDPNKPIIILSHVGMDLLKDNNRKEFEDILSQIKNPTIILCGDAHEIWVRTINNTPEITTGCLLAGRDTKTVVTIGECNSTSITNIHGFMCERGRWGDYSQFNDEVQEKILNPKSQTSTHSDNQSNSLPTAEGTAGKADINPAALELSSIITGYGKDPLAYYTVWEQPYGLLVTDITGVLFDTTEDGREEFPPEIVDVFSQLAKRHISICFTTGRGRTGARHLLLNLAQKIVESDPSLSWETLSSEWACITHNGAFLLTTPDKSQSGFLANAELLCPKMHESIKLYSRDTLYIKYDEIIRRVCKKKKIDFLSFAFGLTFEPVSIRFSLERCPADVCEMIFKEVEKYCKDYLKGISDKWYPTRGRYEQKEMFEYSLVNKSDAVKDYIKRYHPIDESCIIRVADAGKPGGSDYSFLSDGPSFSVSTISTDLYTTCFPVIDWDTNETLFGTKATIYLLKRLHFYPSLCIKSVNDLSAYKSQFASAIKGAKKRSEEVFSFYNTRLSWMDFLYEENCSEANTSRIFDIKSGAISFADYEWAAMEADIHSDAVESPTIDQIRCFSNIISKKTAIDSDKNKPNLMYFLHTDTHVIFRGYLYYSFLLESMRSDGGTDCITIKQWIDIYSKWLKNSDEFVESYNSALKRLYETTTIPISYLARKLVLGGLDNIRNTLIIINTFLLHQYIFSQGDLEKDYLVKICDSSDPLLMQCKKSTALLSDCLSLMYTGVFESQIDKEYIRKINEWIHDLLPFIKERKNDYNYFNDVNTRSNIQLFPSRDYNVNTVNSFFTETFPRWRESDCFIENIAALEMFLSKMSDCEKNLTFWGIPYGSIEHPVLASILCKKHGIVAADFPNYIMLHGNYESRHQNKYKLTTTCHLEKHEPFSNSSINVLIDDTLTTATTLDLAVKCLSLHHIAVNNIVVVRYAGLNRLNHYLTNLISSEKNTFNASAPDVSKFFDLISGMVAEAPYSKLHKYHPEDKKPYEDLLGVFDKAKSRIKNYLSVNY